MHSQSDSFAASFDAIALDATSAPPAAAIDAALSACTAQQEPGFYLIDDASGRFVVDRDFGMVSLASESILDAERDTVHVAHLLVIEHSGERYELSLKLRLTGLVPQVVTEQSAPAAMAATPKSRAWPEFCAWQSIGCDDLQLEESAPFGALPMSSPAATAIEPAELTLAYRLVASARDAVWPI